MIDRKMAGDIGLTSLYLRQPHHRETSTAAMSSRMSYTFSLSHASRVHASDTQRSSRTLSPPYA